MKRNTFYLFIIIQLAMFVSSLRSQNKNIDSVENYIHNYQNKDSNIVNKLNDLSFSLINSDFLKSKKYCELAINIADEINYSQGKATGLTILGLLYYRLSLFDKAMEVQWKAYEISEKMGFKQQLSWVHNNLGNIYTKEKIFDQALINYRKSLEIKKDISDKIGIATTYKNIGNLYLQKMEYDSSMKYAFQGMPIAFEENDYRTYSLLLGILADDFLAKGNYDSSKKYFFEALHYQRKINSLYDIPKTLNGIGRLYFLQKKYNIALDYFESAIKESNKIGTSFEKVESLKGISQCSYELGKFKNALSFYEKSSQLYDSLFNSEVQGKISNIEMIYKYEKKENEVSLLVKEKEKRDQRIFLLSIILIISILFIIIFVIFLLILNRNRKRIKWQSEELRIANRTKDKMFTIIAHDLRNQIGSIKNISEIMISSGDEITDELKEDFINSIRNESSQTYFLLENLLTWAQNQEKNIILQPSNYNIFEVVDDNVRLLSGLAKNKSINLSTQIDGSITAYFDLSTINTVIRNLITNAIKFTNYNGRINIFIKDNDKFISVHIKDDGLGMSDEVKQKIFSDRNTITTKGTSGEKGSGLGLNLCKEFIEKNNGEVRVESELGKGTEFIFTLPKYPHDNEFMRKELEKFFRPGTTQ